MRFVVLIIGLLLPACSQVIMRLPSVEHCQHVTYNRDFNHVQITADCEVGS